MSTYLKPSEGLKCSKCGRTMTSAKDVMKLDSTQVICNYCYNDMLYPAGSTARMESVDEAPTPSRY